MSSKAVNVIVIICLLASSQFCRALTNSKAAGTEKNYTLQVYLPREVTVKDDNINLGQVSIIRGSDSLVTKANEIALGRLSMPGQEIIIDRPTILSRLASNGIPASKVTLTGAEQVTVKQQQQIIKGAELVELARSFLEENSPAGSVHLFSPIQIPADLVLPEAGKNIKLSTHLVKGSAENQAKVQITALTDGKEIDAREVTFRLKYNCRQVVARVDIPEGGIIGPENVKIENTVSNYPEPANWRPPYGLVVKRPLQANTVIRPDMVGPVKPAIIVKRNQTVVIRLEKAGLLVTAIGKTMQDGRVGEYIKVRNVDSKRIILAKVEEDGTVEPIF